MFKQLRDWLQPTPESEIALKLYDQIVLAARQAVFYQHLGVPDDLDGRFEMIALHQHLALRRLRLEAPKHAVLGQALFDVMFTDMDRSLRLMGVSDISIGKRVKAMVKAFYGRVAAYDAGLEGDDQALIDALDRNLYGTVNGGGPASRQMLDYMRASDQLLQSADSDMIAAGTIAFAPPPAPSNEAITF